MFKATSDLHCRFMTKILIRTLFRKQARTQVKATGTYGTSMQKKKNDKSDVDIFFLKETNS